MTFTEYKPDPREAKRGYKGINVSAMQIFITAATSREHIKTPKPYALVEYDKEKKAIQLTITPASMRKGNAIEVRKGVSYAHYLPARIAAAGMPKGRYYLESADVQKYAHKLVFTQKR